MAMAMAKISDVLAEKARAGETCISFEFFPTKTMDGIDKLLRRIAEMGERLKPTFISLTWRSAFKDDEVWLRIGSMVQKQLGIVVLLHLTCHLPRDALVRVLHNARKAGIRNILALRGDSAHFTAGAGAGAGGSKNWRACQDGFQNAIELVHLIRAEHGDHFCVGVAGYPEVHTSCWNSSLLPPSEQARALDLQRLKDKVDAGADFVITQFFYDADVFWRFKQRCDAVGITVPIIPGYAPIQNYSSFQKFKEWVKPQVPPGVEARLAQVKDDDAAVRAFGVDLAAEQCGALLRGGAPAIHFFTLNLAHTVANTLRRLGLRDAASSAQGTRELPWRGLARAREEVRPIFWAHRHSSYLSRTSAWEEFPNGRWGDSRSAATFELQDYYLAEKQRSKHDLKRLWGAPQTPADVADTFVSYMRGQIETLPWCDQRLADETEAISEALCWINRNGFLTINSQPKVNGVDSSDSRYGWGGPGGVCFQKAYVEFFCSPQTWAKLQAALQTGDFGHLSYHAINVQGEEFIDHHDELQAKDADNEADKGADKEDQNADLRLRMRKTSFAEEIIEENTEESRRRGRVNAVTWGVFPGREIIQPTVVDTESFRVWKDEAFELWLSQWAAIYAAGEGADDDSSSAAARAGQGHGRGQGQGQQGQGQQGQGQEAGRAPELTITSPSALTSPLPRAPAALQSPPHLGVTPAMREQECAAEARAAALLQEVHDSWFLVNIVDNEYASSSGSVFDVFRKVILDDLTQLQLRDRVDALETENGVLYRELLRIKAQLQAAERQRANDDLADTGAGTGTGTGTASKLGLAPRPSRRNRGHASSVVSTSSTSSASAF